MVINIARTIISTISIIYLFIFGINAVFAVLQDSFNMGGNSYLTLWYAYTKSPIDLNSSTFETKKLLMQN